MAAQWRRDPSPLDPPSLFFRGLAFGLLLSAGIWLLIAIVAAVVL